MNIWKFYFDDLEKFNLYSAYVDEIENIYGVKGVLGLPKLQALKRKKQSYNGFLYVGLMIKNNEPYLIEYNIRFGDPECQVLMMRLKNM